MKIYVQQNPQQPYVDYLFIACSDLQLQVGDEPGLARFVVIYKNAEDVQLNCVNVVIAGQDYLDWGNSDQYVVDFVLNKLGFVERS